MPQVFVEPDRCKGCELCVHICPCDVLAMSQEINTRGYFFPDVAHPDECNGCRHCELVCPDGSIQVEHKSRRTARPEALTSKNHHYCPGCTHGVIHTLVAEAIDALGIRERTVGIASVGCSVLAYEYFNVDMQQASHGRALAVATGVKRGRPDLIVFTYQGDGDLASIGLTETVHAAARGEKVTTIFVNNAIYGMTGGQMAPTTLARQVTTTTSAGRDVEGTGQPIRVVEMLSTLNTPAYLTRVSVHDPKHILAARKAIRRALEYQIKGACFSLVEILSTCPVNWSQTPEEACDWVAENMIPYYPLGDVKVPGA